MMCAACHFDVDRREERESMRDEAERREREREAVGVSRKKTGFEHVCVCVCVCVFVSYFASDSINSIWHLYV